MTGQQKREYDLIIFGATGFTGQRVVSYFQTLEQSRSLRWAISGRNTQKLEKLFPNIPALKADVNSEDEMAAMCGSSFLLINCVGPYRFYGEQVVRACINAGTHYLDISGEPEFIEQMELAFGKSAQEKKVLVVSACGFDSIPADIGAYYLSKSFKETFQENIVSIESFLRIIPSSEGVVGHFATFESAVYGFYHQRRLKEIRAQLKKKNPPKPQTLTKNVSVQLSKRPIVDDRVKKWVVPFPGADASIVRRSANSIEDLHVGKYYAFYTISSTIWMLIGVLLFGVFKVLVRFSWGRRLMLRFPHIFTLGMFSHAGPNEKQLSGTRFRMEMFGKSEKNTLKVVVAGPGISLSFTGINEQSPGTSLLPSV